jgi:hypothetical protein
MHAERSRAFATRPAASPAEILFGCTQSLSALSGLGPWPEASPPDWSGEKHMQIVSLRELREIDQIRERAQMFPTTFAAYRTWAHDLEAANAGRLTVLVSVLQRLHTLRDDPEAGGEARKLSERILAALARQWAIRAIDVPLEVSARDWCTRVTRNYRLLPRTWRYV